MITPVDKRLDGAVLVMIPQEDLDLMTDIYERERRAAQQSLENGDFDRLREQVDNLSKIFDAIQHLYGGRHIALRDIATKQGAEVLK